jgi:hypothetical protein
MVRLHGVTSDVERYGEATLMATGCDLAAGAYL